MRHAVRWIAIAGGAFLLWLVAVWPPPLWYRTHWPSKTAFMTMRGDAVSDGGGAAGQRGRGFPAEPTYRPVPIDSITDWLPRAAMIGEDNRFLEHGGIDYLAILEALGYRRSEFVWDNPRDRAELRYTLGTLWTRRAKLRGASLIGLERRDLVLRLEPVLRRVDADAAHDRLERQDVGRRDRAHGTVVVLVLEQQLAGQVLAGVHHPSHVRPARVTGLS